MKIHRFPRFQGLVLSLLFVSIMGAVSCIGENAPAAKLRFAVSFSEDLSPDPLDGRVLLMLSIDESREPRFQISDGPDTQLVFGIDVDGLAPGREAVIDNGVFGYPLESLSRIPAGEYWVQALLHVYETFHRSDGHTVKLPMDRGEGQQWNRAPGNLYSTPVKMHIDPRKKETISVVLDKKIPPIPDPPDTKYIKHVKIQSELLTEFWGRPMYLGANVLLPEGFDEHPEARYPLIINHGHFPYTFGGFRETPPDPDLEPEYSSRFNLPDYNITVQEYAYKFYQYWTAPDTPRMIIIEIQHANPFYDSSYAVNSANVGPYGDAITYELIPYIEEKFRGLGQGWSRFLYGGSTGGWQSLAAQIFYPEEYNACYAACPDPIDFRAYTVVDIYEDENAYFLKSPFKKTPRPGRRNYLGHINCTLEDMNHRELVLGTRSRSGAQWDIWEAMYSPAGADGYPRPIWDKRTGVIDREIAEYWRENYDLSHIVRRDWKTLGPKLQGKIHIYVGDMDNYYLNNAVYLIEEFLESTKNPYYGGEIDYGDRAEHCWNGDHELPNAISRLRYHQMFIPKILDRILKTAPRGADTHSWRY
ncbi:MAG: alpha/beta hydrolase-fold protein [Acidobacteriota bacterium]|nr:alpha/beta hydrolase-fold protein [Acidobacteriota bacterium]